MKQARGRAQRARRATAGETTYTVNEAAEILQFHPDAIRYWLRVGELTGELVEQGAGAGGDWAIRPEALVAFLRQNNEMMPIDLPPQMHEPAVAVVQLAKQPL